MALAREERNQGLDSHCVSFLANPFSYPVDEDMTLRRGGRLARHALRLGLIRRACTQFDVVHFNFGTSMLPFARSSPVDGALQRLRARLWNACLAGRDVGFLRSVGRAVVVTYQGDDARQAEWFSRCYGSDLIREVGAEYYPPDGEDIKRRSIEVFTRSAQRIYYLNPDLAGVLPACARFQPYAHVDHRLWAPVESSRSVPVILHAPSHRGIKGTRFILEAVDRLRQEGRVFEFRLVENVPYAEAIRQYAQADLLVDQLLIGWYGGLAVELMALGKPVICHVRQADLGCLPASMRSDLPVVDATPASILPMLRSMLDLGRDGLRALGRRSRAYVERWHDPRRIVGDLVSDYRDLCGMLNGGMDGS